MAKTIEQLQAFIDSNPDLRQVVNELADYLQANPPGESATTPNLAAVLAEDNDADGATIDNLADPSTDQQAATKKYVDDNISPGYLEYVALLTQTGTNAPVATVLANTLGGAVVWTRNSAGDYTGTLAGAFPANKVVPIGRGYLDELEANSLFLDIGRIDNNSVVVATRSFGSGGDDFLAATPIIIRVYP